jgi:diguanylate cyclase (GGDEF)-like protein
VSSDQFSHEDILGSLDAALWIFDFDHKRVVWANAGGLRLWRADSLEELRSRDLGADMSPAVDLLLKQYRGDFLRLGSTSFTEVWTLHPKGEPVTIRVVFRGIRLRDGRMAMLAEVVSHTSTAPEQIRSAEAVLHMSAMVTLIDRNGWALYRNPAARAAVPADEQMFLDRFVDRALVKTTLEDLQRKGTVKIAAEVRTAAGVRWHEMMLRDCVDAVSGQNATLITEIDITERKESEAQVRYLAYHDMLTGLPNRIAVVEEATWLLAKARETQSRFAVLFVDLDKFKQINDTLGHSAGDHTMREVAARLRKAVRPVDFVGRMGGDEFVVLIQHATDQMIAEIGHDIVRLISRPIFLDATRLSVTPSIGAGVFPDNGDSVDRLFRCADFAMYDAKMTASKGVARYTEEMMARAERRLLIETGLREAIEESQLRLVFQPRVDIQSGQIVAVEALVRWRHQTLGDVSPAEFIPICEELGLIGDLGHWVIQASVQQQIAWSAAGRPLKIAINISPRQFETGTLHRMLIKTVEAAGLSPSLFDLEITESLLIGDDERVLSQMKALSDAGFTFSVDDFGTGYSNLAYLQRYPLNTLKIDRCFVSQLQDSTPVTEMIIAMCKLLNLHIVAEGVETQAQLDWLRSHGCHEYQGFLFSPPIPPHAITALLSPGMQLEMASGN